MAALRVKELPEGNTDWLYEVKWDGYRVLIIKDGESTRLISRNEKDLTNFYPTIRAAGKRLAAKTAVVDGELVALDAKGLPSFNALQNRSQLPEQHRIAYYAFDLLHLNGRDLTKSPLEERREALPGVIADSGLLISEVLPGAPGDIVKAVKAMGLEGVVAKRRASAYSPGERSGDWVKVRFVLSQEFVVGGYRPGNNGVDAILVGVYEDRQLKFAGKIKAGFVPHTRRELARTLKPLQVERCPFPELPDAKHSRWGAGVTAEDMAEIQWVTPKLVVQISFLEWTEEGRLRHASFVGLRPDKTARTVSRE